MVRLEPIASEDARWLDGFLTGSPWPYHAGGLDRRAVAQRLHDGDPGQPTFAVVDGADRVEVILVDDLDEATPTFDLRIATAHRGRGVGTAALGELA